MLHAPTPTHPTQEEYIDQNTLYMRVRTLLHNYRAKENQRKEEAGRLSSATSGSLEKNEPGTATQGQEAATGAPSSSAIKKEEVSGNAGMNNAQNIMPDAARDAAPMNHSNVPNNHASSLTQPGMVLFTPGARQQDASGRMMAQIPQTQAQIGARPTLPMGTNSMYYFLNPSQVPGPTGPFLHASGYPLMSSGTGNAVPMQGSAYNVAPVAPQQNMANQQQPMAQPQQNNGVQQLNPVVKNENHVMVGTGNTLAVAGAPAGTSDAESNPRHGGMISSLVPTCTTATSQIQPFMSNGAPVLMKNSASMTGGGGMMIHLGGLGGMPGAAGLPPSNNAPLKNAEGMYRNATTTATTVPGQTTHLVPLAPSSRFDNKLVPQEVKKTDGALGGAVGPNGGHNAASIDELFGNAGTSGEVIRIGEETQTFGAEAQGSKDDRKRQILKQQRWLLFLRHCAKCTLREAECTYGINCTVAKRLWQHLIHCKNPNCGYERCVPSRKLLKHHQKCNSLDCPVCAPVKEYVSKQREQLVQERLRINGYSDQERQEYMRQFRARRAAAMKDAQQTSNSGFGGAGSAATDRQADATGGVVNNGAKATSATNGYIAAPIVDTQAIKRPRIMLQEQLGTSLLEYFDADLIERHMSLIRDEFSSRPAARRVGHLHAIPAEPSQLNGSFWAMEEESTCKVCHQNKLTFHPESLYCYRCDKLIKRNNVYWATPMHSEISGHICHPCYNSSANEGRVLLQGAMFPRDQLEKRKNDKEQEEEWVQCDACEGWVHMICGLFNKGRNNQDRGYLCPPCLLEALRKNHRRVPKERPQAMLTAKDLPRCDLSDVLEERLQRSLTMERMKRASAIGATPEQVSSALGTLTVRVINNVVKRCEVKQRFASKFSETEGYPLSFPYRQKVILLFQRLDGVDLCLYCLYVQEYGEEAPAPNTRTVYLSYLDSVKYFQPEDIEAEGMGYKLRTMVYHEILLGYLAYAKAHGFTSMYIWSCPPLRGEDYIFYCHSDKQKNISQTRLREWYLAMLRRAKEEGIVVNIANLFDSFFQGGRDHCIQHPSITSLPYLDGDYWVGEAENILATMEEQGAIQPTTNIVESLSVGSIQKCDSNADLALAQSSRRQRLSPMGGSSRLGCQLLNRLGEAISKMKDDFIVVHMYECCTQCRQFINGSKLYRYPHTPIKITVKSERSFDGIALDKPGGDSCRNIVLSRYQLCQSCYDAEADKIRRGQQGMSTTELQSSVEGSALPSGLPPGVQLSDLVPIDCPSIPSSKDTIQTIDNEFFDTRVQFLSLCQGNHYQFDSVRRARHSSMMVLYHLHNPTEPAFTTTCNVCKKEVPPGEGYRCHQCDFDVCPSCNGTPAAQHPHPLEPNHNRKFDETRMRLTDEERAQREAILNRTMEMLKHASSCKDSKCSSSNCQKIKALFAHARTCQVKFNGGCHICRKTWMLLHTHAKLCSEAVCRVPKCMEIRMQRRRLAARQDDMRRAAYREMLKEQQKSATNS